MDQENYVHPGPDPGAEKYESGSDGSGQDGHTMDLLSDEDLDEFLKNAERLSDQTMGDMRLYDCSMTTDDKSFSNHLNFHHDCSDLNSRHYRDLSCSMLIDGDKSLSISKVDLEQVVDDLNAENRKKDKLIKKLVTALQNACDKEEEEVSKVKDLASQVSWVKDNIHELTNLSFCSCALKNSSTAEVENFRLSTYVNNTSHKSKGSDLKEIQECRSSQTSPVVENISSVEISSQHEQYNKEQIGTMCQNFLSTAKNLKEELSVVRRLIKQPFENREDFPIKKIMTGLRDISEFHVTEIESLKGQLVSETRHHHEAQNTLKDEIKTMKMRFQDKLKQKENELAELKARLVEDNESGESVNEISLNVDPADFVPPVTDDSFNTTSDEETYSNLTRTKVEYLKLTPSEYVDDEVIEAVHIPDSYRQHHEDCQLKLFDLEKKFESNKRYLEEITHDREIERDEFQQTLEKFQNQIDELRKENSKLYEVNKQNLYQIEEYSGRLKCAEEDEMELVHKHEKTENELKGAVEKIYELREIIRDLEKQVDSLSTSAIHLKEQNQVLLDELEKQELMSRKDQPTFKEQDSYGTIPLDVTDEIQTQLQDLARRIEFKINEMDRDSLHFQTRPNSSCSGVASAISNEDISCRELAGRSSRNFDPFQIEDIGSQLLNGIRRLESQFESLTRLEDVITKKLRDSELRSAGQKAKLEELENQIANYQDRCSNQTLKIADLEGQIDSLRFDYSNQNMISALQSRLGNATKQLEEFKKALMMKEKELCQVKTECDTHKAKESRRLAEQREVAAQTTPVLDENLSFADFTFDGVCPEKIRRMDQGNLSQNSIITTKNVLKEHDRLSIYEPEFSPIKKPIENRRNFSHSGDGDRSRTLDDANVESPKSMGIDEMEKMFNEFQHDILEKDNIIKQLQDLLARKDTLSREKGCQNEDIVDSNCEQERVSINTAVNPPQVCKDKNVQLPKNANKPTTSMGASNCDDVYEICTASDYDVDGEFLTYIGSKIVFEGRRPVNYVDPGRARIQDTDHKIEIATLNTQINQIKRALDEERNKSEELARKLKSCEEAKAELRSRSALPRTKVQNMPSSVSVQQLQQKELVRQIEEGSKIINIKQREIRDLTDQVRDLESKLNAKLGKEQELSNRLNSTVAQLKRCEEHGRELSSNNQEQFKEIRRLRSQIDRVNVNSQSLEAYPVTGTGAGGEYFENYIRAKSHKKALAWQKKYLSSVVMGYKSIIRQTGHGYEHPELLQTQVPLAPSAAGILDMRRPITKFRIGVLSVIALVRMKYMVTRWYKKRPGESSPDFDYQVSRHASKVDSVPIRPTRSILVQNKVNHAAHPAQLVVVENVALAQEAGGTQGKKFEDISEYLNRFESLENEISSSLSRNRYPS